ncbi:MAG: energy-coupling factor transporter transmembrane component T [Spirochaetales bacterium]|uniref:Energy-coupling factor transporter transmembrane component T n=1 Tax=Candidatus Thalassospirochaeta sargassi TaxID=3119039 RepID=A0AAJ1ICI3_9SPIO|nr:energy-coupling factor transporter transmembrane component T [Spirochaetales bacterium]
MITETFVRGRGPLYSFDPRPKFILLVYLVVLFLSVSSALIAGILVLAVLLLIWGSLGFKKSWIPVKSILPILILTAVLTPPFNTEGSVLLNLGEHTILTDGGVRLTLVLILRFTGITSVFYLFFSTTRTESFILALRSLGLPYRAALTVTISLRYIPDMFNTYHRITDAHKLRTAGTGRENGGFRHRLGSLFPVLISILIHAVKTIPSLAMALDSKGLGRANPRTSCRKLEPWMAISRQLFLTAFLMTVLTAVAVLLPL